MKHFFLTLDLLDHILCIIKPSNLDTLDPFLPKCHTCNQTCQLHTRFKHTSRYTSASKQHRTCLNDSNGKSHAACLLSCKRLSHNQKNDESCLCLAAHGTCRICTERTTSSLGGRMSDTTTTKSPFCTRSRRFSSANVRSTFSSGSAPKSRRKGMTPHLRFSRCRTSCLSAQEHRQQESQARLDGANTAGCCRAATTRFWGVFRGKDWKQCSNAKPIKLTFSHHALPAPCGVL